ncbi:MAG TPA: hypothetical protein VFI56_05910 [Vicinamibacterales bacterium]|nr:hypothetical protein [Vicinamibacterales bacterium]
MVKAVHALFMFTLVCGGASVARAQDAAQPDGVEQDARPKAIEYSDAYETRAKIHKYASYATLPLFATELALGQTIYNDPNARSSTAKGAHIAVGTAITGLFAVNSVTGIWNLWESRADPAHHKLKLVHGILMLGADAGFVATFATGPNDRAAAFGDQKQQHRAIALTSIGVATGSYLLMLFGNK